MFACQLLVHAEHVSHLTTAYTNITGRHIGIGAYVSPELHHESLAETHDFRL